MNTAETLTGMDPELCLTAVYEACERIAPVWPLDRWIAVNPWWGHRQQSVVTAHEQLQALNGTGVLMPPTFYEDAWREGRITPKALKAASGAGDIGVDALVARLERHPGNGARFVSATKVLMANQEPSYLQHVRELLGRVCSQYFDQRQARWQAAPQDGGLYGLWLGRAESVLGQGLDRKQVRQCLDQLSGDWKKDLARVANDVQWTPSMLTVLTHHLLLQVLGWASWCRGEDFRNQLDNQPSDFGPQLAACLLVSEWLAVQARPDPDVRDLWQAPEPARGFEGSRDETLWIWHRAYEQAWQSQFFSQLESAGSTPEVPVPEVQAAFCIDVRSEVMRRHLEAALPEVQTLGVAGFFGMPVAHGTLGPAPDESLLPGLLSPSVRYQGTSGNAATDRQLVQARYHRQRVRDSVRRAKYSSLSTFTVVETTGLACGACCGKNGGTNARLAAELVNDPDVRQGLADRGIRLPERTVALAAEHCTVTDRITVLDDALLGGGR